MDDDKGTYRIWETGLRGSTWVEIKATSLMKAKEAYAAMWGESVSNLDGEEIVPAN